LKRVRGMQRGCDVRMWILQGAIAV